MRGNERKSINKNILFVDVFMDSNQLENTSYVHVCNLTCKTAWEILSITLLTVHNVVINEPLQANTDHTHLGSQTCDVSGPWLWSCKTFLSGNGTATPLHSLQ